MTELMSEAAQRAQALAAMTRDEAVEVLAHGHVATYLLTTSGILPERKLPTEELRAVQARVREMAAQHRVECPRDAYERAYDVLAHGGGQ